MEIDFQNNGNLLFTSLNNIVTYPDYPFNQVIVENCDKTGTAGGVNISITGTVSVPCGDC